MRILAASAAALAAVILVPTSAGAAATAHAAGVAQWHESSERYFLPTDGPFTLTGLFTAGNVTEVATVRGSVGTFNPTTNVFEGISLSSAAPGAVRGSCISAYAAVPLPVGLPVGSVVAVDTLHCVVRLKGGAASALVLTLAGLVTGVSGNAIFEPQTTTYAGLFAG
jgi:hypothetical protein